MDRPRGARPATRQRAPPCCPERPSNSSHLVEASFLKGTFHNLSKKQAGNTESEEEEKAGLESGVICRQNVHSGSGLAKLIQLSRDDAVKTDIRHEERDNENIRHRPLSRLQCK